MLMRVCKKGENDVHGQKYTHLTLKALNHYGEVAFHFHQKISYTWKLENKSQLYIKLFWLILTISCFAS